jgi:hypothetical protein
MAILYHEATRSFFNTATHAAKSIPADAGEISSALYVSLLAGQSTGKTIMLGEQGLPVLIDPVPDPDAPLHQERAWRDGELLAVMWLRDRHRDQLEIAESTTLTAEQFGALLLYMQALRDWPQSADFPDSQHRPLAPEWIAEQTQ